MSTTIPCLPNIACRIDNANIAWTHIPPTPPPWSPLCDMTSYVPCPVTVTVNTQHTVAPVSHPATSLPDTGSNIGPDIALGGTLLLLGVAAAVISRGIGWRRRG